VFDLVEQLLHDRRDALDQCLRALEQLRGQSGPNAG
jgi:hypothetical protein